MPARVKYGQLAPKGMAQMTALEHYLNAESGLEHTLLGLVRLRTSQMNSCEYCMTLHTAELLKLSQPQAWVAAISEWRNAANFTERERAALAWTEAVTNIQDGHAPDDVFAALRAEFTETEAANLTLVITTINAWNRIAIALGNYPGHSGPVVGKFYAGKPEAGKPEAGKPEGGQAP